MVDQRYKHKKCSRTNERTVNAVAVLISLRIKEWSEAGIIPAIKNGEFVDKENLL